MVQWLDGNLTPSAQVSASSGGNLLGWGVFTTLAVRHGRAILVPEHYRRLARDAQAVGLSILHPLPTVSSALEAVIAANGVECGMGRLTLTRCGDGRWDKTPGTSLLVSVVESPVPAETGLTLGLSPHVFAASRPLAHVKTTSYLPFLIAAQEALQEGWHDCVLSTPEGWVSEASRASLAWRTADNWYTPSLETGCLNGLGRYLLSGWLHEQGQPLTQGKFPFSALLEADELIVISAATGPRSVGSLHGDGRTQTFTQTSGFGYLASRWAELTGKA